MPLWKQLSHGRSEMREERWLKTRSYLLEISPGQFSLRAGVVWLMLSPICVCIHLNAPIGRSRTSHPLGWQWSTRTVLIWAHSATEAYWIKLHSVKSKFAPAYDWTLLIFAIGASWTWLNPRKLLLGFSSSHNVAWERLDSNGSCWRVWTGCTVPLGRQSHKYSRSTSNVALHCWTSGWQFVSSSLASSVVLKSGRPK